MLKQRFYNPAQLSDSDLAAMFIARQAELAALVRLLDNQPVDGPLQHVLIIGARGMGKTTLGLRTLVEVRRTPDLAAKWQPVPFFEESYGIVDLASLWLTALNHLSDAVGDPQWRRRGEAMLAKEKDDDRLAAGALAVLRDYRAAAGKRPILFIENLDIVFEQFRDKHQLASLRAILQERNDFVIIGTASSVFDAIINNGEPFYEFFRQIRLQGLEREDANAFLAELARREPYRPLRIIIDTDPGRIEVIRSMTGGNPRLIAMAARLMAESPHGQARDDLEKLIDEQTPYFKARIEVLPPQARQVFHTLAEGWRPMAAREVAMQARLSSSHASAQIKYLMLRGYIEGTHAKGRKKTYQIMERFYNIYYVLRFSRNQKQRLERLIEFITGLFGNGALRVLAEATIQRVRDNSGGGDEWLTLRILAAQLACQPDAAREFFPNVVALCGELGVEDDDFRDSWVESDDPDALVQNMDRLQQRWRDDPEDQLSALRLIVAFSQAGRHVDAKEIAQMLYETHQCAELAGVYSMTLIIARCLEEAATVLGPWMHQDQSGIAVVSMVRVLAAMGKADEANELAVRLLDFDRIPRHHLRYLAAFFAKNCKLDLAERAIAKLESAGASDHDLLVLRGRISYGAGRYTEAEKYLKRAIAEKFDDAAFDLLVRCLFEQSKWGEIVDLVYDADLPTQSQIYRAMSLFVTGRWDESFSSLEHVLRADVLDDGESAPMIALTLILYAKGGKAQNAYDLLSRNPVGDRFEPIQHALARLLRRETEVIPAEMESAVATVMHMIDSDNPEEVGALADLIPTRKSSQGGILTSPLAPTAPLRYIKASLYLYGDREGPT